MNSNLLDFVLSNLRRRDHPWTEVAKASGVPYDTLKKIAHGITPNPGVKHVQALADYFAARPLVANVANALQAAEQGVVNA
jgi:hypothetical protein